MTMKQLVALTTPVVGDDHGRPMLLDADDITVSLDVRERKWITRTDYRGRSVCEPSMTLREFERYSRVFVFADAHNTETIYEGMANRYRRPHSAWRRAVTPALIGLGVNTERMRWSVKAGCFCPCSPGFILPALYLFEDKPTDFYVHIRGDLPIVDERKPARMVIDPLAHHE